MTLGRWMGLLGLAALIGSGCGDKTGGEDSDDGGDDTGSGQDDTGEVTSPSSFTSGQYRLEAFALSASATEGADLDGDGEVDNKLPTVLNLAATLTGQPLKVDDLNTSLASDLAKGSLILLVEAEQVGVDLTVDVLLGMSDKSGAVSVDPVSYGDGGVPNSRMAGAFSTEVDYTAAAQRVELPFPILPGGEPVLVPLELVTSTGTLDADGNTVLVGGAVPVDDFMAQVVEPLIPSGPDYDPSLYLDMSREELIAFIYDFASGETVADITLSDGRKAVSAAVTWSAGSTTF